MHGRRRSGERLVSRVPTDNDAVTSCAMSHVRVMRRPRACRSEPRCRPTASAVITVLMRVRAETVAPGWHFPCEQQCSKLATVVEMPFSRRSPTILAPGGRAAFHTTPRKEWHLISQRVHRNAVFPGWSDRRITVQSYCSAMAAFAAVLNAAACGTHRSCKKNWQITKRRSSNKSIHTQITPSTSSARCARRQIPSTPLLGPAPPGCRPSWSRQTGVR